MSATQKATCHRFVLSTSLGGDVVNQFSFDAAAGALSPNEPATVRVKDKAGPHHLVFHPNGTLVYLMNEPDGTIVVFTYDPTSGTISEKQTISTIAAGIRWQAVGRRPAYHAERKLPLRVERTTSSLAAFNVNPDGNSRGSETIQLKNNHADFNIDLAGKYLLAVGTQSNGLSSYASNSMTGHLTKLNEYPEGKRPNWVEIINLP